MTKVLVIDDEKVMAGSIKNLLKNRGYFAECFFNPITALNVLQREHFDIVLTDFKMPNIDGLEMIERIKEIRPEAKIILMTAYSSISNAVEAMKKGADEYISKPFEIEDLEKKLEILGVTQQKKKKFKPNQVNLLGESEAMLKLKAKIKKIAKSDATVLITGESGTGKELVAAQIHNLSSRSEEAFIAINMAAIPLNLIESEFFGYKKGSFTGADKDYKGKFLSSDKGSLFMDEVGEIPLDLQAKLLRVLQESSFHAIGSSETVKINTRFIAATNQNLYELTKKSLFREDLYYRLNIIELNLPPLRERLEDINLLVKHFVLKHGTDNIETPDNFVDLLRAYHWPGNVRELENIIHRCIVMVEGNTLNVHDLPKHISGLTPKQETPLTDISFKQIKEGLSLIDLEKKIILKALEESNGNKTNAAKLLKITRRKLYSRMEKHGINLS
ncbi:MAG: DNA-binding response regulator [Candidatus Cloacimonadota bacterium]|nr:MAG: DNA-binding response regulator [Candidatus Cloacimonadota bacterium]